jgi:hypothetical protein
MIARTQLSFRPQERVGRDGQVPLAGEPVGLASQVRGHAADVVYHDHARPRPDCSQAAPWASEDRGEPDENARDARGGRRAGLS